MTGSDIKAGPKAGAMLVGQNLLSSRINVTFHKRTEAVTSISYTTDQEQSKRRYHGGIFFHGPVGGQPLKVEAVMDLALRHTEQ